MIFIVVGRSSRGCDIKEVVMKIDVIAIDSIGTERFCKVLKVILDTLGNPVIRHVPVERKRRFA
jgi:hypothetical protein